MIIEHGTKRQFKRCVLDNVVMWPELGDVYVFKVDNYTRRWRVIEVNEHRSTYGALEFNERRYVLEHTARETPTCHSVTLTGEDWTAVFKAGLVRLLEKETWPVKQKTEANWFADLARQVLAGRGP